MASRHRTIAGALSVVLAVLLIGVAAVVPGVLRPSHALRILAGSELRDVLDDPDVREGLRRATGVRLEPTYSGTLQGVQQAVDSLSAPDAESAYAASWFSSASYLQLVTEQAGAPKLPDQSFDPTMRSPVVLGIRDAVADRLGWIPGRAVSWREVAAAAAEGRLTFGMTDAAASNSGFSAMASVASAVDRSPATPLGVEDIDDAALRGFFGGRVLKAESSAPLTEEFCRNGSANALINYESEILRAPRSGQCRGDLRTIYPEGSVYAEYPLVLLDEQAREDVDDVRSWLLSRDGQAALATTSLRRPVDSGVPRAAAIPNSSPAPLSLPDLTTSRALISRYLDILQRPARTFYVVDVSLSMQGDRINELRSALCGLAGTDPTVTTQFTRFRASEVVTVLPFSGVPRPPVDFRVDPADGTFGAACDYVRSLTLGPDGGTAVYDALATAYDLVARGRGSAEGFCPSIVLMTDGESNSGRGPDDVDLAAAVRDTGARTFTIRFGDASGPPLQGIADAAGGRAFDATQQSLRAAFEELRATQC